MPPRATSSRRPGPARALADIYRGKDRLALISDLAMNELSAREIALREGVKTEDIQRFREEHVTEIAEVRAALAGKLAIETAGLWITKKQNRLAEYQAQVEDIRDFLAELRETGVSWSRSHRDMLKVYLDLFKQTAEELGAYPQRAQAPAKTGQTVHYVIDTADPAVMQ